MAAKRVQAVRLGGGHGGLAALRWRGVEPFMTVRVKLVLVHFRAWQHAPPSLMPVWWHARVTCHAAVWQLEASLSIVGLPV